MEDQSRSSEFPPHSFIEGFLCSVRSASLVLMESSSPTTVRCALLVFEDRNGFPMQGFDFHLWMVMLLVLGRSVGFPREER